jgi:hypothetical protein
MSKIPFGRVASGSESLRIGEKNGQICYQFSVRRASAGQYFVIFDYGKACFLCPPQSGIFDDPRGIGFQS